MSQIKPPGQLELVQPQVLVVVLQVGALPPQSELLTHWHWLDVVLQVIVPGQLDEVWQVPQVWLLHPGLVYGQSEAALHATHVFVDVLHAGVRTSVQSLFWRQSTQVWLAVSHTWLMQLTPPHSVPPVVPPASAAPHVPLLQLGYVAGQFEFARQEMHGVELTGVQMGWQVWSLALHPSPLGQSEKSLHWTHILLDRLQTAVGAEHCPLEVQEDVPQKPMVQTSPVFGQSLFCRHWRQSP